MLLFLVVPILVPVPLSFNSGSFFTFPLAGLSTRWYEVVLGPGDWRAAIGNSLIIAIGDDRARHRARHAGGGRPVQPAFPARRVVMRGADLAADRAGRHHRRRHLSVLRPLGLASTYPGIILAHTVLATPFVVVTVGASLTGFDRNLMRAASICGAKPADRVPPRHAAADPARRAVRRGFRLRDLVRRGRGACSSPVPQQRTLPIVMFTGLREQLSPAITAAATLMMWISILLLVAANLLARRSRRNASALSEETGGRIAFAVRR